MTTTPPESLPGSNPYTNQVRELIAGVRAAVERMPGFTYPTEGAQQRYNFAFTVTDQGFETVAMAMDESSALAAASQISSTRVRDALAVQQAFKSFINSLETLTQAARYSLQVHRADAALDVFQVYKIAKGLNRRDRAMLVPHLAQIRKALRRRGAKSSEPEAEAPEGAIA